MGGGAFENVSKKCVVCWCRADVPPYECSSLTNNNNICKSVWNESTEEEAILPRFIIPSFKFPYLHLSRVDIEFMYADFVTNTILVFVEIYILMKLNLNIRGCFV